MDNDQINDDALAALFDAAKADAPEMSDTFMARLSTDAAVAVPVPTPAPVTANEPALFGKLRGFFAASGLTGAAMVGIWIGFVMPETLNTLADGFSTEDTISLSAFLPGADLTALAE